jgi:hypothetical protein
MGALRDKILAAQEMPTEEVPTDEWAPYGVPSVRVRGLTAAERERWEKWVGDVDDKKASGIREKLVVMTVVEEVDGSYQPALSRGDVTALGNVSSAVIVRLWDVARRLSGMQTEAELQAQANPSKGDQDEPDSPDSP